MIRSYKALPNYPGKTDEPGSLFREQLAVSYGRLLTLHDEISEILEDLDEDENSWIFGPAMNADSLRSLQDELKTKLRAQRELARRCAYTEDDEMVDLEPCQLPADLNTMNDYAYRILMPLPGSMTDATGEEYGKINPDIIDYRVRRVSETRCEDDLDDPGCLTNQEINEYLAALNAKVPS